MIFGTTRETRDAVQVSMSNTKKELLDVADQLGLEVPSTAKKQDIIDLIEEVQ